MPMSLHQRINSLLLSAVAETVSASSAEGQHSASASSGHVRNPFLYLHPGRSKLALCHRQISTLPVPLQLQVHTLLLPNKIQVCHSATASSDKKLFYMIIIFVA
jgi:hypothetical protein